MKASDTASYNAIEQEIARGPDISIIALVNGILHEAYMLGASDVHIDPSQHGVRVRLRVDGVLHEAHTFSKNVHQEVISRIKVLAELRTDEHTKAQDGRFRYVTGDTQKNIDVRVSMVPTYHGENAVLRLLSQQSEKYSLADLGFSQRNREAIENALSKQSGMILVTGPTGSGKTTTLYTLLSMLNKPEVSIVTVEDPIEFAVDSIEQIQVNSRSGLTFANGLRSILRQDPDIIMVGEIRDTETASIAVNTALTGHLLLSTLHTSDAVTTVPRLLDMGIDPYLVSSTITIVVAQRLVRKICVHCKGKGCDTCHNSGYKGRIALSEVLVADAAIRESIIRRASSAELKQLALAQGMTSMLEDGFEKVRNGETTLEEVLRVIHD